MKASVACIHQTTYKPLPVIGKFYYDILKLVFKGFKEAQD
jgi:hypothetical protein